MTAVFRYIVVLFFLNNITDGLMAQNKTNKPSTFEPICFYTIKTEGLESFKSLKASIDKEDYGPVYSALKKMRTNLKKFKAKEHHRGFELWYIGNYSDFSQQANVAKESTLALLKHYENRLRQDNALYYEHRHFLELYLSFCSEAFYSAYWFMSQERYFSKKVVQQIQDKNKDGHKLFKFSEFYTPFITLNQLSEKEQSSTADYLDLDKKTADQTSFISYSYLQITAKQASLLLQQFNWDDTSVDIDVNREIRAFKQFLEAASSQQIYLVARFNLLQLKAIQSTEKGKNDQNKVKD